ncbi:hypothetical protein NUU61_000461 [Penicillium alfredii]|uniref:Uncharacterized protein n=1 Tax=Penicillium alfredii TaxID=1506179 RepID=A0A9W9G9Z0_9EURO|nr:uncharacterized protein NUU61_000461 [Penicillium alfredii]KAJ5114702.1 hypothetical protein NUU61_000461 [Penicillium alfredii]
MLYAACWSDSEKRWGSSTLDLNLCYEFANDNIRPASKIDDEISNDDGVLKCGDNAGSWGDGSVLDGMDGLLF